MAGFDEAGIRQKLEQIRAELDVIADEGASGAAVVELDQSRVGRLSRMDAMQAQAMAQASEQRRAETQRRIAAALRRLDDGEYGDCRDCGEPIDPRRLQFDPTVQLCIDCADKSESR